MNCSQIPPNCSCVCIWIIPSCSCVCIWIIPSCSCVCIWIIPSCICVCIWIIPSCRCVCIWIPPSCCCVCIWIPPNCCSVCIWIPPNYSCVCIWILTKRLEKKLEGNNIRILMRHSTKLQWHGHLFPISKTIQVRQTKHAGYWWRSKDEFLYSPVLVGQEKLRLIGSLRTLDAI